MHAFMSVVVGLVDNGDVYMASDSATAAHDYSWIRENAGPKVFKLGHFLVGIVGRRRVHDLIVEKIQPVQNVTPHGFASLIRVALREGGCCKVKDGIESMDAEVLLGWRGELYHIVSDFGVFQPKEQYDAIGAGAQYALGALHVMAGENWMPGTKVDMAVEAAAAFSPYVMGRVKGLRLKSEEAA